MIALVALILTIIGAVNWGLTGVFKLNLVTMIAKILFNKKYGTIFTSAVYALVGLAGVYVAVVTFRPMIQARSAGMGAADMDMDDLDSEADDE